MLRRLTVSLTALSLLLVSIAPFTATAFAAPAANQRRNNHDRPQRKHAPEFDIASSSNETVRLIVQTKGRPTAEQDQAIQGKRGTRRQTLDTLDAMIIDLPKNEIAALAAREDILYVSPDRIVTAQLDVTREATGAALVQAGRGGPRETPGFTGKGVTIAIIDSGISAGHPDLRKRNKSRVLTAVNFTGNGPGVNGDGVVMGDGDGYGHGTGVAGVAAGNGAASGGYAGDYSGIAPEANLVDLKVLDQNGVGTTSATLNAINWAITYRNRYDIRVINLSLGTPPQESFRTDPLSQAVARAVNAGIVVVCSAGNYGRTEEIVGYEPNGDPIYRKLFGGVNSPGNSPYAITVGATDTRTTIGRSDDTVAQFSSKGPTQFDHLAKPDLLAPGRRIVAALSQDNPVLGSEHADRIVQPTGADAVQNAYFKFSGTSFSAPVVAGVVALMIDANKSLTPLLTKAALLRTANALPGSLFHSKTESLISQGAGQVNAAAAVEMARAIVNRADRLKAGDKIFRNSESLQTLSQSFTIGGETVAQSAHVLYANGVMFANRPVLTNGIMLSDGIILGDGIMLSDGIIVGDGIMISDGVLVSNGIVLGDGVLVSNGIMLSDGIILGDGIMLSDSIIVGDGIMLMDGILVSDGIMLMDGILVSDGIMVNDGILVSDGIMLMDGILVSDGIMLMDGILVSDSILHTDGIVLGDGVVLGSGVVMGDGILVSDGIMVSDGYILGSGVVIGDGFILSSGMTLAEGILVSD